MFICPPRKPTHERSDEILLTFKLEHMLTKDQILEIYMNQIWAIVPMAL